MLWVCWDQPEDGGDFQRGEDDGKLVARLVPDGVELKFGAQEFLVEEEECGEGLGLGAGGDLSVDSEMGEEGIDLAVGVLVGVDSLSVEIAGKAEVAVDPGDVGFFGPFGDLEHLHFVAELIELFGLFGWGGGGIFLRGSRPPVEFQSVAKGSRERLPGTSAEVSWRPANMQIEISCTACQQVQAAPVRRYADLAAFLNL